MLLCDFNENIIILFHCHRLQDADDISKVFFCLRPADSDNESLKNPICCSFNHIVDALCGAGRVEDDSRIGRHAVFVILSVKGNGTCYTEAIGPAIG